MAKLTISLVQMQVARCWPEENLRKGEAFIAEAARRGSNLVCFPEMWTTGFDWDANQQLAPQQEEVIARVAGLARRYHIWINGSMLVLNDEGRIANTSILFDDTGRQAGIYRKTHLFSLIHEDKYMAPGDALCTVDAPWGLTGLSICYDLRFPELYRTYALKGVKVQLAPSAFPHPRLPHWKVLVRARAIENQMFMIAVNQVGQEAFDGGNTVTYFGSSCIIDPWGETVVEAGEQEETLLTATIDTDKVDEVRSKMKVLRDRRPELYELD
jgi:predicted amidohydrolase